jgi:hypothetical protein
VPGGGAKAHLIEKIKKGNENEKKIKLLTFENFW